MLKARAWRLGSKRADSLLPREQVHREGEASTLVLFAQKLTLLVELPPRGHSRPEAPIPLGDAAEYYDQGEERVRRKESPYSPLAPEF